MGEELAPMTEEFQMKCRERDYKKSGIIMQIFPKTKEKKIISARKVITVKASKLFKDRINQKS